MKNQERDLGDYEIKYLAGYMKAFSNPLRLKIIYMLLDSERTVTDIVNNVAEKQCTVSLQLKFLMERNIVERRREKKYMYYGIKDRYVPNMLEMVKAGLGAYLY